MKKHNKQHDARAASFKRVAKRLHAEARRSRSEGNAPVVASILRTVAIALNDEARVLRQLR